MRADGRRPRSFAVATIATVVTVAGVLTGCGASAAPPAGHSGSPQLRAAPAFSAPRLDGKGSVSVASLRGETVLLSSWAIWCTVCQEELPRIQQLSDAQKPNGLRVIGVDLDNGSDEGPAAWAKQHHLTFDMLHDTERNFQAAFNAVGVPTSVLIDAKGNLVHQWSGALDVDAALPLIKKTLKDHG